MLELPRFVTGKVFFDLAIDVGGHTFRDCVFDGCILTRSRGRIHLVNCLVTDCRFIGGGWPPKLLGHGLVS